MMKPFLTKRIKTCFLLPIIVGVAALSSGCDPQRTKKCEWYLTPNEKGDAATTPGLVSLCLSNFKIKKKNCSFMAEMKLVEKFNGVPFRYVDVDYTSSFPKKINNIGTCKPEN